MVKTHQEDVRLKLNIAFKEGHLKRILSKFGHKTNGSKDDLVDRLYRLVCSKNKVKNAEKIKNFMREIYTKNLNKNPQLKCKIKEMQLKLKEKEKAKDRRRNKHLEDSSDDSQSSSSSKRSEDNSDDSFSNKIRRRVRVISSDSSDDQSLRVTITHTKSNSNINNSLNKLANENRSIEVIPDNNSSEDEIIFVCEKKQDRVNQTSSTTSQTSQTTESDSLVNTNTNLEKNEDNLREKINLHLQGIGNLQLTKDILARIPNSNRMNFSFMNPTANQTITTATSASSNSTRNQNSNQTVNFSFFNPTINQTATTFTTSSTRTSTTSSTSTTYVASNLLTNLANSVPTSTQNAAANFSFRIPSITTTATTTSNLARNQNSTCNSTVNFSFLNSISNSTIPKIMLFRDLRTNQISIATSSTSTTRMTSNSLTNLFPRLSSYNVNSSTINNSCTNVGTNENIANQKPEENNKINFSSAKSMCSLLKCKKIIVNNLNSGEITYKVLIQDKEVSLTKVKQRLNNTSSSEIEVETNDLKLLLICPITNKRIKIPIRSSYCFHLECFDAEAFFLLNYKKPDDTWKCPKCMQSARLSELIFDELLKEILYKTEEDCQAVIFNKDGTWTPEIINGNDEIKTSQEKIVEEIQIDDDDDDDDDDVYDKKKELQTAKQNKENNKNNEKIKIEPTNSSNDNNNTTAKDKSLNAQIAQAQAHKNLKRKYNYHKTGEPSTHGDWFVPSQTRSIANTQQNLRSSSNVNSNSNNSQPNDQEQNQFHNAHYQHSQSNYRSYYPQVRYSNQQTQDCRPSSAHQVYQYQYQQQNYQQQSYQQQNYQHQQRQRFSNQFQNQRNPAIHHFNNYYQPNYSFNQNLPYNRLIEFSNQQFNADYNSFNSSEQDNLSSRNYQYQINTNQYSNRFSGNIANNNYDHQTSERQNIRLNREQTSQNEFNLPDLSFAKDKHIKYETITIIKLNGQKKQTYKIVCDLCKCDLSLPQDFKIDAYKKNIIEHVKGQRHNSYLRQTYSNHNLNSCIGGSGPTN